MENDIIIAQTNQWIIDVVVGCNFCPFAAREIKKKTIRYIVVQSKERKAVLEAMAQAFILMNNDNKAETIFIILPEGFNNFSDYLQLLDMAEAFLKKEKYRGIYQLASFHPEYLFADTSNNAAENYTNRSPYPMLHLLREESVSKAIDSFPDTENIPSKNIEFAKTNGLAYMQALLEKCKKTA